MSDLHFARIGRFEGKVECKCGSKFCFLFVFELVMAGGVFISLKLDNHGYNQLVAHASFRNSPGLIQRICKLGNLH